MTIITNDGRPPAEAESCPKDRVKIVGAGEPEGLMAARLLAKGNDTL